MIATSIEQIPKIVCFDDSPRGRLLLGAAYLFYKQGYDKTTVRQLGEFIGIQSGSLFHHFKSKDDILATVMEQTIIYNFARLKEAAERSNKPEQQLRDLIKAELISITGDTGAAMAVLVHEWFALSKEKQDYLLKMRNEYEQVWLDVIEKLRALGKVKHDAFIWRRLVGGSISWTVTWYRPEGKVKIDELTGNGLGNGFEMSRVYLRKPQINDLAEIKKAYQSSIHLHQPWTYPPTDFEQYLQQEHRYFVCLTENHAVVGTFNISNIIRGQFHSAYLGYEAFYPYIGQGYMRNGLQLILQEAFQTLNLHRLEANIQPENYPSIRLIAGAGFVKEGFSRQYLRVGGKEWRDHERWAILNTEWTDKKYLAF